jgi:nitroreductase
MNSFLDLVQSRRSVRAYRPEPVEADKLRYVLEAARWAPSAKNAQPYKILVLSDPAEKDALSVAYPRPWFRAAPHVVAICVRPAEAYLRPHDAFNFAWVDAAIAMDHLQLAAAEQGLGTCWIGAFDPAAAAKALHLPDGWEVAGMTPLGHPAPESAMKRPRKPLGELLRM